MKDDEQRSSDKVWLTAGETWQESLDIEQQWEEWERMGLHHCKTVLHVQTPNTVLLCFGLLHSCDSPLYICMHADIHILISGTTKIHYNPLTQNYSVKFTGLPIYYPTCTIKICSSNSEKKMTLIWQMVYQTSLIILYSAGPFKSETSLLLVTTDTHISMS